MTVKEFFSTFSNIKNYIVNIVDIDKEYSWLVDTREINNSDYDWSKWEIDQWWIGTYFEHNDCFCMRVKRKI